MQTEYQVRLCGERIATERSLRSASRVRNRIIRHAPELITDVEIFIIINTKKGENDVN
jgi:hypothetical protein